jgi:hypothetical protein
MICYLNLANLHIDKLRNKQKRQGVGEVYVAYRHIRNYGKYLFTIIGLQLQYSTAIEFYIRLKIR